MTFLLDNSDRCVEVDANGCTNDEFRWYRKGMLSSSESICVGPKVARSRNSSAMIGALSRAENRWIPVSVNGR